MDRTQKALDLERAMRMKELNGPDRGRSADTLSVASARRVELKSQLCWQISGFIAAGDKFFFHESAC
jgi:hypothetical protein